MFTASGNHHLLSSGSWSTASNSSLDSDGAGSSSGGRTTVAGKEIRVVVVGKAGVGKSALVVRFITGRFLHSYNPTLEDTYQKNVRVDGENYALSILDTAGQDDIHLHYYVKHADVLLVTFAINDLSSLAAAKKIKMAADMNTVGGGTRKTPVVLVGCKGDTGREVDSSELLKLARDLDCTYVETSSAEGRNCALPFRTAIKLFNYSCSQSDSFSSSDPRSAKKGIVKKCKHLLGVNQGPRRDISPSRRRSRTPEITVSMEY